MSYSNRRINTFFSLIVSFFIMMSITLPITTHAASATEIDVGVQETLKRFKTEISGGETFLKKAKAMLIFPSVIKAGLVIGGEYGEGALQIGGKTTAYYSTAAASLGFQLGAQSKSVVLLFMTNDALKSFQNSEGWKAGVDGSVALIEWGVGEDINTLDVKDPIIGFVFSNKGLMYNLTLEGSKFTKIVK